MQAPNNQAESAQTQTTVVAQQVESCSQTWKQSLEKPLSNPSEL